MIDKIFQVETDRLLIRLFRLDDATKMLEIMKNPVMFHFLPDTPWQSIDDAHDFLNLVFWLYDSNHKTFRHFFAIEHKKEAKVIGYCGVGGIAYDRSENELFYGIDQKYWNMGYANEAAYAMLDYAFNKLMLNKIIAVVDHRNEASKKVIENIGLRYIETLSRLDPEFDAYNGQMVYCLYNDHAMGSS